MDDERGETIVRRSRLALAARLGTAVALLGLIFAASRGGWLDRSWLEDARMAESFTGWWIFILAGTLFVSCYMPKTMVSLAAGAVFGTLQGTLIMALIAGIAASLNYGLARWILGASLQRWIVQSPRLGIVTAVARDGGFRLQLLLRLAPIHTVLISYTMGTFRVPYLPFLAAACAGIAGQWIWIFAGAQAGLAASGESSFGRTAALVVAVVSAICLAIYLPRAAVRQLERGAVVDSPVAPSQSR